MSDSFDINALMAQAQGMAAKLQQQQEETAALNVTGQSGGGAVSVEMTGAMEFLSVSIKPEAVDPEDISMLEDLILAALNDAMGQLEESASSGGGLDSMMGGMDLGGMDIGGMLGALGGGGDAGEPGAGEPPE